MQLSDGRLCALVSKIGGDLGRLGAVHLHATKALNVTCKL